LYAYLDRLQALKKGKLSQSSMEFSLMHIPEPTYGVIQC
jgi:hypothetical protein